MKTRTNHGAEIDMFVKRIQYVKAGTTAEAKRSPKSRGIRIPTPTATRTASNPYTYPCNHFWVWNSHEKVWKCKCGQIIKKLPYM